MVYFHLCKKGPPAQSRTGNARVSSPLLCPIEVRGDNDKWVALPERERSGNLHPLGLAYLPLGATTLHLGASLPPTHGCYLHNLQILIIINHYYVAYLHMGRFDVDYKNKSGGGEGTRTPGKLGSVARCRPTTPRLVQVKSSYRVAFQVESIARFFL